MDSGLWQSFQKFVGSFSVTDPILTCPKIIAAIYLVVDFLIGYRKRLLLTYSTFHLQMQLRTSGYSEPQLMEICAALSVLAKYGILATLGLGGAGGLQNYLNFDQTAGSNAANSSVFGAIGQVNLSECIGN